MWSNLNSSQMHQNTGRAGQRKQLLTVCTTQVKTRPELPVMTSCPAHQLPERGREVSQKGVINLNISALLQFFNKHAPVTFQLEHISARHASPHAASIFLSTTFSAAAFRFLDVTVFKCWHLPLRKLTISILHVGTLNGNPSQPCGRRQAGAAGWRICKIGSIYDLPSKCKY